MKDGFPSNLLNSEGPQFLETEVEGEPVGDIALVVPVYQRVVVVHVVGGQSRGKLRLGAYVGAQTVENIQI